MCEFIQLPEEGQKWGFLIWLLFSYCGLVCIACLSTGKVSFDSLYFGFCSPSSLFLLFIHSSLTNQTKKEKEWTRKNLSSPAFVLCFFQFLKICYCHITTVAWVYINRMEYVLLQLDTFLFIFKFILAVLGKKTSTFITGSTRAIFFRIWGKL